jgi:hypothetical protein
MSPESVNNPLRVMMSSIGPMPLVRGRQAPATVRDRIARVHAPESVRAGLYLFAGFWEEAHETAQAIETPEGSYWHAIVHRQEPDAGNASYWFRRVGQHAIFPALARRAAEIDSAFQGRWDPYAFIDYCERAAREGGELERRAIAIQQEEWDLLLDWCLKPATGE